MYSSAEDPDTVLLISVRKFAGTELLLDPGESAQISD